MSRTSRCGTTDLITFLAALFIARRRGTHRYPGIPHILDAMLRDATLYFLLSTVFQALLVFFGLFAPVGGTRHDRGFLITLCSSCVLHMV